MVVVTPRPAFGDSGRHTLGGDREGMEEQGLEGLSAASDFVVTSFLAWRSKSGSLMGLVGLENILFSSGCMHILVESWSGYEQLRGQKWIHHILAVASLS